MDSSWSQFITNYGEEKEWKGDPFIADFYFLKTTVFKNVYEPSDDTYLLVDALHSDIDLIASLSPIGSGVVLTSLSMLLLSKLKNIDDINFVGTDINPEALKIASDVASRNIKDYSNFTFLKTDLLEDVELPIDVVIFNPPYVPTTPEQYLNAQTKGDISAAWAGGADGAQVLMRLLQQLKTIKPRLFYLLVIHFNNPKELMNIIETEYLPGSECEIVLTKKTHGERQAVVRIKMM